MRLKQYITLFMALIMLGCSVEYETYTFEDAFFQILIATEYRKGKCGESPSHSLFPLGDAPVYAVDQCAFSLIREPCPFHAYPAVCSEIFGVDIPGVGL
jgi:hypothetical protein